MRKVSYFFLEISEPLEYKTPCVPLKHFKSVIFVVLQDSGEIYKDLITALSDPLSVLFRKAYSLQMVRIGYITHPYCFSLEFCECFVQMHF